MPEESEVQGSGLDGRRDPSELDTRIQFYKKYGAKVPEKDWYPWVFDHINLLKQDTVLELGCGSGDIWLETQKRDLPAEEIFLSDLEMEMVREARQKLEYRDYDFGYICCDAQQIPLPDNYFDVVIANHLLHLVDNISEIINEILRVLKNDGRLYATTKSAENLSGLNQILGIYDNVNMNAMGSFTLEHGEQILSQYFEQVERWTYREIIQVDETEPLISFVNSKSELDRETKVQIQNHITEQLDYSSFNDEGKVLRFDKNMGLFAATNSE